MVEPDAWDSAGAPLVTVDSARERLGYKKRDAVNALIDEQALELVPAARLVSTGRRGRRPTQFVRFADVERVRADRLARIGAVDVSAAVETEELRGRIATIEVELQELRARLGGSSVSPPGDRVGDLERENAALTDRVARLRGALDAGLAAQNAQLDQIRHLVLASGVWEDPAT